MSSARSQSQCSDRVDQDIKSVLYEAGYIKSEKITNTLQGSIWRSLHQLTKQKVVIKVTNRQLHNQNITIVNGETIHIQENIRKERQILKYLTDRKSAPKTIIKYKGYFKSNLNYYVVMEDGGHSLFDFVAKAHRFVENGQIEITEWQRIVQIIFKQMIECIEYVHNQNICHFDISLENFLINDIDVVVKNNKFRFQSQDISVKLCDFGLSELYGGNSDFKSNKFCGKMCYKSPQNINHQIFNAKSNDIWCLGICLFLLCIGGSPWYKASKSDSRFNAFMKKDGFKLVLKGWDKLHYVNDDLIELLKSMLQQNEKNRATIQEIKKCPYFFEQQTKDKIAQSQ